MPTTNPTIFTSTWTLVVAAGDDFLLSLPFSSPITVEVATLAAEPVAPDTPDTELAGLTGHLLTGSSQESLNRGLIGPGYVYPRSSRGALNIVLTTWTP